MAAYKVGHIDNVNPSNGNLFLDIPLLRWFRGPIDPLAAQHINKAFPELLEGTKE